jgi:hypothetical protein
VNQLHYSPVTRGRVCRLQLLLVLVSAIILGSESRGLMTIFYCLRFDTPPTWRARWPYLYPPGTGWLSYILRHWVPFSSAPTTRRGRVEVFEPASMRCCSIYYIRHGPHRKHHVKQFFYCCVCIRCGGNVFTDPLPSNDRWHTKTYRL